MFKVAVVSCRVKKAATRRKYSWHVEPALLEKLAKHSLALSWSRHRYVAHVTKIRDPVRVIHGRLEKLRRKPKDPKNGVSLKEINAKVTLTAITALHQSVVMCTFSRRRGVITVVSGCTVSVAVVAALGSRGERAAVAGRRHFQTLRDVPAGRRRHDALLLRLGVACEGGGKSTGSGCVVLVARAGRSSGRREESLLSCGCCL